MLTYKECLDLCGLEPGEVEAIAEHEHVEPMVAAALGNYLITHDGEQKIRKIIMDDIKKAETSGDAAHCATLKRVLDHFVSTHKM